MLRFSGRQTSAQIHAGWFFSRQGAADALVEHSQAVVRERRIVHRVPFDDKPPLVEISSGFPMRTQRDPTTKVRSIG